MAHRAFVVLLLLGAAARAETNFGARGQVVPFGGVSYTHGSAGGNSADQLTLAPGVFWFPTNSLAIGGSVQYAYGSGAGFTAHNLGFEPLVGFGVPLGDRFAFFPRVGMAFSWRFPSPGNSTDRIFIDDVGGEITSSDVEAALAQWFRELQADESKKLDGYAAYLGQLEMEADKAKAPNLGIGKDKGRLAADWGKQISAYFELHKRYPKVKKNKTASVKVSLVLNRLGNVMQVGILESSGDAAFDEAAIAMIRRSDPVPRPPAELTDDTFSYSLNVNFNERK